MAFLSAVAARVIIWILENGGAAVAEWSYSKLKKNKEKKINEENTKKHNEDIATNAPPEKKGRSGADLINGKK